MSIFGCNQLVTGGSLFSTTGPSAVGSTGGALFQPSTGGGSLFGNSSLAPGSTTGQTGASSSLFGAQSGGLFQSTAPQTAPLQRGSSLFAAASNSLFGEQTSGSLFPSSTTGLGLFSQPSAGLNASNSQSAFATSATYFNNSVSNLDNLGSAGNAGVQSETDQYLRNIDKRLSAIENADSSYEYLHFSVSSSPPTGLTISNMNPNAPAADANERLEQEILQLNDAKLLARFLNTKAGNPDINKVFIVPIRGIAGLHERDEALKASIEVLDDLTDKLLSVAKQHKARLHVTAEQIQRIKRTDKAMRFKLIQITKQLEDDAKESGRYEYNPVTARENEQIIKKFDSFFKTGEWDSQLNVLAGHLRKLKEVGDCTGAVQSYSPLSESTTKSLNRILEQQKRSIQAISENVDKIDSVATSLDHMKRV